MGVPVSLLSIFGLILCAETAIVGQNQRFLQTLSSKGMLLKICT
jgi:hypothetical protein